MEMQKKMPNDNDLVGSNWIVVVADFFVVYVGVVVIVTDLMLLILTR